MPRIRSIKPEFWTDGAMIALPFEARLFYIGSWNFACDRGHLPDDPFGLKLKVLPADPVDGATLVQQLVESGRMERITLPDGRGFLGIPRFTDHQRIDTRWNSRCPVCAVIDSGELTETHASYDETHGDSHKLMLEGRGGEGKGVGGETANAELSPFCPNHPNGTEKPCRACQNARLKYQAAQTSAKNKPTPTPRRAKECDLHPGYPIPCDRCARDAADAS